MIDLGTRSDQPELMDAASVGRQDLDACLTDIERLSRWTLAARPTLAWLGRLVARHRPGRPITLLDAGSGRGAMLRRIGAWATRLGLAVELTGVDINPWARASAERATPPGGVPIRYETADVFALDPARRFDVILSALFTHHLADRQVAAFLRWMERSAGLGWFVNDLHRHPLPYWSARLGTRLMRLTPMVAHDAPLSVARAFTRRDWHRLLAEAAIDPAQVEVAWHFPFRYGVGRIR